MIYPSAVYLRTPASLSEVVAGVYEPGFAWYPALEVQTGNGALLLRFDNSNPQTTRDLAVAWAMMRMSSWCVPTYADAVTAIEKATKEGS